MQAKLRQKHSNTTKSKYNPEEGTDARPTRIGGSVGAFIISRGVKKGDGELLLRRHTEMKETKIGMVSPSTPSAPRSLLTSTPSLTQVIPYCGIPPNLSITGT